MIHIGSDGFAVATISIYLKNESIFWPLNSHILNGTVMLFSLYTFGLSIPS